MSDEKSTKTPQQKPKRQPWTRQQIIEKKIDDAGRDDTQVLPRPLTEIAKCLYNIVPRFDRCMSEVVNKTGMIGGLRRDVADDLIAEANDILLQLDSLAQKTAKHTRSYYKSPKGFNQMRKMLKELEQEQAKQIG